MGYRGGGHTPLDACDMIYLTFIKHLLRFIAVPEKNVCKSE